MDAATRYGPHRKRFTKEEIYRLSNSARAIRLSYGVAACKVMALRENESKLWQEAWSLTNAATCLYVANKFSIDGKQPPEKDVRKFLSKTCHGIDDNKVILLIGSGTKDDRGWISSTKAKDGSNVPPKSSALAEYLPANEKKYRNAVFGFLFNCRLMLMENASQTKLKNLIYTPGSVCLEADFLEFNDPIPLQFSMPPTFRSYTSLGNCQKRVEGVKKILHSRKRAYLKARNENT